MYLLHRTTLMGTMILLGVAFSGAAQDRENSRFQREDVNRDGKVSREEFSGPDRVFRQLDKNGDGYVTRREVFQRMGQREKGGRAPIPFFIPPEDVIHVKNVPYGKGGDRPLFLDILQPRDPPDAPMAVIVFIHGGGWRGGDKTVALPKLLPFAQAGYFCATINYRLTDEAIFPAQVYDSKCAIRYLRAHAEKYGIDPARIGVWGASAGGHLAALLGTSGGVKALEGKGGWPEASSRVQAVCDWFGPTDFMRFARTVPENHAGTPRGPLERLLGGPVSGKENLARRASPVTYISGDDPPFLIMHGRQDKTVPFQQSEELHARLTEAGVSAELVLDEKAEHGGPFFRSPETRARVMAFFDKHLRGTG